MRKVMWIFALLVFCFPALHAQQNLTWAMALVKDNEGIPFSQPVVMKDGDIFSIIIQPNQACYAYMIIQDSERQVVILLSEDLAANEIRQTPSIEVTPPSGLETFHVIMSLKEQTELQRAIDAFKKQSDTRTLRDLNNAIMRIRRNVSQFKEDPEKPVAIAGAFRGIEPEGTKFSGVETYVKTIVINH